MTRSILRPVALVLVSAVALASCGGNAEDRKQIAELEQSVADELRLLREEVAAAKLTPNDKVHIVLGGSGTSTKIVKLDHPEKRACKHPEADCGRQVRWVLQGGIPQDWYVQIEQKETSPDQGCFAEPKLMRGHTIEPSGEPDAACQYDGAAWEYSVTLFDQDGAVKSVVDPLIIVNWSP